MSTPRTNGDASQPADGPLMLFLAGRDTACPQCEYNLRDLQGDRCPECAERLVLRVGIAEPKQAMLIAGLCVLSAVAGFNGIAFFFGMVIGIQHGLQDQLRPLIFTGAGLLIAGMAAYLWLRCWRIIRRLPTSGRASLLLVCCSILVADTVLMFICLT